MSILAAAVAETPRGWGNTIGIGAGLFVIYLIWRADMWWRGKRDPSPTETGAPLPLETSQVRAVSSHVSPDETAVKPAPAGWWGRIENVNGSLRRVYQSARHITQTGDSPPLDDAISDDEAENEFDLPLDEETDDDEADHEGADNGEVPVVAASMETREEYVARCIEAGVPKPKIVAALQEHYGLSRPTAYRVVGPAAERRPAA